MKREFLKSLNLESDVIDKIMTQYGEDIEKFKKQADEIEESKKEIKSKDRELEELKKLSDDTNLLKKQIENLQNENKLSLEKYQTEIKQMKINNAVEKALTNAKAKNNNVVLPLLSEFLSKAEIDDTGNIKGLDSQIELLTKNEETKFLFDDTDAQKPMLKGIVPGSKTEPVNGSIDQSVFDANKNNPDWINKNWDEISNALQNGTIK